MVPYMYVDVGSGSTFHFDFQLMMLTLSHTRITRMHMPLRQAKNVFCGHWVKLGSLKIIRTK